jgi:TolB-like protein/class 3 adenylate cyclase/Flp pilus assembly protein TadD
LGAVSAEAPDRKLAAIMFTDMVGYSALAQRDDDLALDLLEEHRRVLRKIFPRFHGIEIKTIGDGFLVEFHSALKAVQCAIEIQRALAKRNHDVPPDRRVEIRIGIHIGDVVHRNDDVYGDGVNIASRIEPFAGAGGICVSEDVERQIRNSLDAHFEKLAPTELKNISIPMDLFRIIPPWEKRAPIAAQTETESTRASRKYLWTVVALVCALMIGVGWWWSERRDKTLSSPAATPTSSTGAEIPAKSIAVLPFENLSRDPDNAYFVEGIQDEILTRLSKIADLKVISRTSTEKYKSHPDNLRDIARELGVAHILEGSVQKYNDKVRVNVQLINALTDAHLWADTYDRHLTDIFGVESEIAKMIAETLQAKLTGSEKALIAAKPTSDTTAYDLYHKGRSLWEKRSGDNLAKAISFYEQAIGHDPKFALAYAGLANSYVLLPLYFSVPQRGAMAKAREAALKGLQLDSKLAEGHMALGKILNFDDLDLAGAALELQRAIELQPNNATAHQWYGNGPLDSLGRFEQAIAETKRAVELDPLSPIINTDHAFSLYYARRYDEALAHSKKTIDLDPAFFYSRQILGMVLHAKGDLPGAMTEFEKAQQLSGDPLHLALLAVVKTKMGDKNFAQQALAELDKVHPDRQGLAYDRALVHLASGNKEEALRWLEQSYADRDGANLSWINVEPILDPLRGEPRFEALVQKVIAPKSEPKP